jgi:hypothetical protein
MPVASFGISSATSGFSERGFLLLVGRAWGKRSRRVAIGSALNASHASQSDGSSNTCEAADRPERADFEFSGLPDQGMCVTKNKVRRSGRSPAPGRHGLCTEDSTMALRSCSWRPAACTMSSTVVARRPLLRKAATAASTSCFRRASGIWVRASPCDMTDRQSCGVRPARRDGPLRRLATISTKSCERRVSISRGAADR